MKFATIVLCFVATAAAARPPLQRITYDVTLTRVERQVAGGPVETANVAPGGVYEDALIRVAWLPRSGDLAFTLSNRAGSTMRIRWANASYVGPDGKTDSVLHDTRHIGKAAAAGEPTSIMRDAAFAAFVRPLASVRWQERPARGWFMEDLIPTPPATRDVAALQRALPDGPLTIRVLIPVEVAGQVTEYVFVFKAAATIAPVSG